MHVCCFGGAGSSFWHLFDTGISSKNSQKIWVTLPSFPYRKSVANIFHTSSITKVGYRYLLKIDIQVWNLKVDFLNSAVTAPKQSKCTVQMMTNQNKFEENFFLTFLEVSGPLNSAGAEK